MKMQHYYLCSALANSSPVITYCSGIAHLPGRRPQKITISTAAFHTDVSPCLYFNYTLPRSPFKPNSCSVSLFPLLSFALRISLHLFSPKPSLFLYLFLFVLFSLLCISRPSNSQLNSVSIVVNRSVNRTRNKRINLCLSVSVCLAVYTPTTCTATATCRGFLIGCGRGGAWPPSRSACPPPTCEASMSLMCRNETSFVQVRDTHTHSFVTSESCCLVNNLSIL